MRETLHAVTSQKVPRAAPLTHSSDQLSSYNGLITEGYRSHGIHQRVSPPVDAAYERDREFLRLAQGETEVVYGIPVQ